MVTALIQAGFSDPRINPLSCQDKVISRLEDSKIPEGKPWGDRLLERSRENLDVAKTSECPSIYVLPFF